MKIAIQALELAKAGTWEWDIKESVRMDFTRTVIDTDANATSQHKNILVIDDDIEILNLVTAIFCDERFHCRNCA
ncbi:MAG: hypothetical protein GY829_03915 [Gammaproteobacteria bacterium]|nr:hypothetical protein [Gammaproteobacteria bacterium]